MDFILLVVCALLLFILVWLSDDIKKVKLQHTELSNELKVANKKILDLGAKQTEQNIDTRKFKFKVQSAMQDHSKHYVERKLYPLTKEIQEINLELKKMEIQTEIFDYLTDIQDQENGYSENLEIFFVVYNGLEQVKKERLFFDTVYDKVNYLQDFKIASYKTSKYAKCDIIIAEV